MPSKKLQDPMIEIERKFLVGSGAYKSEAFREIRIVQGYLNSHPERSVRVRIKGKKGFITIKGKSNTTGTSRFEWEKEIPVKEAEALLKLCEDGVIEKTRYLVPGIPVETHGRASQHVFEVDEFSGSNAGLVIAEIELSHEDEAFTKPAWLGEEVTGQNKYYNASLSNRPFKKWQE